MQGFNLVAVGLEGMLPPTYALPHSFRATACLPLLCSAAFYMAAAWVPRALCAGRSILGLETCILLVSIMRLI